MALRSRWTSGNLVFYNTSATGCLQIGSFHSTTQSSGLKLSSTRSANFRVYGDDGGAAMWAAGSVPDLRNSLSRLLITADQTGGHVRLAAELGQLKAYNAAWNTEQAAGVYGYLELVRASGTVTFGGYGKTAAVLGCVETSGTMTVDTNHILAGVAAISKLAGTGLTQTGKTVGILADIYDTTNWSDGTARTKWGIGVYVPARAAVEGIRVGDYAGSYATGSALAFSATNTAIARFYGESTADLTSAINARTVVARHLVVTSSATVAHETYGLIGQVCVKNTTFTHLHAGVMGTIEASTAATFNSAYAYGVAGVIARVDTGTSIVTATKPVSAFSAVYNAGALSSGASVAFAACSATATNFTYFLAADHCDYFFYAATGTNYESGVKITGITNVSTSASGVLKVKVGSTDYYIPLWAAAQLDGE